MGVILPHLLRPNHETPALLSPKYLLSRISAKHPKLSELYLYVWCPGLSLWPGLWDLTTQGVPTVVGICCLAMLLLAPMFEVVNIVAVGTLEIRLLFGWSCSAELAAGCKPSFSYCKGVMLRPSVIFRLRYLYILRPICQEHACCITFSSCKRLGA